VEAAAFCDVWGGGTGLQFLTASDPSTVAVLYEKARRAKAMAEIRDHNLAIEIINTLAKAVK
jgi:hypothetical protein